MACNEVVLTSVCAILPPLPAVAPVTLPAGATIAAAHEYVVPIKLLLNTTDVVAPEHTACDEGVAIATGIEFTVMVPVFVTVPQPPVNVIVYGKIPGAAGVPLMFIVFADQVPVTPEGRPIKDAPVAPVVL